MKYYVCIVLLANIFLVNAQQNDKVKNTRECIEKSVNKYLIESEIFDEKKENNSTVLVVEIIDRTLLDDTSTSIYAIEIFTSHSPTFLLLKEKQSFKILNCYNTSESYEEVISFLKKNFNDEMKVINYMEKVTEIFKQNQDSNYKTDKFPNPSWIDCNN